MLVVTTEKNFIENIETYILISKNGSEVEIILDDKTSLFLINKSNVNEE